MGFDLAQTLGLKSTLRRNKNSLRVVAAVASIAIPFAAPAISGAIGLSGFMTSALGSATWGSIAGSAIVGAGLGGIAAEVSGRPFSKGAIAGAVSGGIGGWASGPYQTPDSGAGLAGQPGAAGPAGVNAQAAAPSVGSAGTGTATTAATAGGIPGGTVLPDTAGAAAAPGSVAELASQTGSEVASRLNNPDAWATVTMMAGAQIMGAALAPEAEMSPEQKEILEMRKQELARLKEMDEKTFNQQMAMAKQFLTQAEQNDPNALGLQRANAARVNQGRAMNDQLARSKLHTGREVSESERRRMALGIQRTASTEYDKGFSLGLNTQTRVTEAAARTLPRSSQFSGYINQLAKLGTDTNTYQTEAQAKTDKTASNIAGMFAAFNTEESRKAKEEREKKKKLGITPTGVNQTAA